MYKIKERAEDFIVKERLDLDLGSGRYVYFKLKKKNWNSFDAIKEIAKRLGVKFSNFGFAGLKDRNALTEQYVSVSNVNEGGLKNLDIKDIEIEVLGRGNKPISIGDLKGNDFEIVVRDLENKKDLSINKLENYYDEQRFSSNNFDIGKCLIKKNFEKACDLLKLNVEGNDYVGSLRKIDRRMLKLYIGAYQGYLFNYGLGDYLKRKCGDIDLVKYSLGEFVFCKKDIIDIKIPLVNFDSVFDNELIDLYRDLLEKESVSLKDFVIKEIPELVSEGVERDGFVSVDNFSYVYSEDEGRISCVLKFGLPKGSYGSLVVKKLFT